MCYVINLNLIEEIFHGNVEFIFLFLFDWISLNKQKNEHIYTDKTNNNKQKKKMGKNI